MAIVDIFLLVLIISATVLCFYLIISLRKISRNVDLMQADIHQFMEAATPVVRKLENVADRLDNISSTAERHVTDVSDTIDGYVERSKQYVETLKSESTNNQVVSLISNLRAIVKGLSVFLRDLRA
jgi:uncharacterized membrane-anchored protein